MRTPLLIGSILVFTACPPAGVPRDAGSSPGGGTATSGGFPGIAGGNTAGGNAAGGITAGGNAAGGNPAGGNAAGGSAAGGITAGGSAGGRAAGGSAVADAGRGDAGVIDAGVSLVSDGGLFDRFAVLQLDPCSDAGRYFGKAITTGDLDRDGHADLVVSERPMCVFYGRGDGTFEPQRLPLNPPLTGTSFIPGQAEIVNLNDDALPDVVVGNTNLSSGGVTVYLGQGQRSFVRVDQRLLAGSGILEQLTPLPDGDGGLLFGLLGGSNDRFSLARIWPDAGVTTLASSGDLFQAFPSGFEPAVTALVWLPAPPGRESVMTLETTERLSSANVFSSPGRLRHWQRDGGGFEQLADLATAAPPVAGGINGAAWVDQGFVFSTLSTTGPRFHWFADGGLTEPFAAPAHGPISSGRLRGPALDVVLYGRNQTLRVYGAEDGGFELWSEVPQLPPDPTGLAVADFNEDGRLDIVVLGNALGDNRSPFLRLLLQKR